jgi:Protein of unknown function (DUF3631)
VTEVQKIDLTGDESPLTAPVIAVGRRQPCPLDMVEEFCSRFVYASPAELDALAVWIAHTYVYAGYGYSPRLGVFAKSENSGKSTVLKMVLALANKPVKTMNASANAIYAIIAQQHPTLCLDESDNIFGKTGEGEKGRVLRGIANEGVEEDGVVLRMVGGAPTQFPVFGPMAFAGIGQLPKTMMTRCVLINLKPAPEGIIQPYDKGLYVGEAAKVKEALQSWVTSRGAELNLYPDMPEGFYNRAGQIWRVMVGIGDAAGPAWGKRIRDAAMEIALGVTSETKLSPAEDILATVSDLTLESDFLPTSDLMKLLQQAKENGRIKWCDWVGEPMVGSKQLALLLRPYGIESQQKWLDGENRRGYYAADFHLWNGNTAPIATETGRTIAEAE